VPDPSGEFVLVADLGIDALVLYVREEVRERPLLQVDRVATPPGSGPRHVGFSPDGRFAFVVHEMSNDVASYRLHRRGELEHVSTAPTVPEAFQGDSAAADLHVHPSGRYLYASNRGHDSIAVIEVHEQGHLEWAGCTAAGGGNPRGFALTPDGAFLVAAGAAGDTLTAFRIDESSGELQPTGASASVPSPVCVGITAGV
jgi:6-phosphogluconolactonase